MRAAGLHTHFTASEHRVHKDKAGTHKLRFKPEEHGETRLVTPGHIQRAVAPNLRRGRKLSGKDYGRKLHHHGRSGKTPSDEDVIRHFSNLTSDTKKKIAEPFGKILAEELA